MAIKKSLIIVEVVAVVPRAKQWESQMGRTNGAGGVRSSNYINPLSQPCKTTLHTLQTTSLHPQSQITGRYAEILYFSFGGGGGGGTN